MMSNGDREPNAGDDGSWLFDRLNPLGSRSSDQVLATNKPVTEPVVPEVRGIPASVLHPVDDLTQPGTNTPLTPLKKRLLGDQIEISGPGSAGTDKNDDPVSGKVLELPGTIVDQDQLAATQERVLAYLDEQTKRHQLTLDQIKQIFKGVVQLKNYVLEHEVSPFGRNNPTGDGLSDLEKAIAQSIFITIDTGINNPPIYGQKPPTTERLLTEPLMETKARRIAYVWQKLAPTLKEKYPF